MRMIVMNPRTEWDGRRDTTCITSSFKHVAGMLKQKRVLVPVEPGHLCLLMM